MSYNSKIYASAKDAMEQKRRKAIADADKRTAEVGKLYPEIGQVDAILAQTGLRIMEAIRMGQRGLAERMASLEEENALLLEKIMTDCGFKPYKGEWWHFTDTDTYPVEEEFVPD